jgi:Ca2+-transporting ATPase
MQILWSLIHLLLYSYCGFTFILQMIITQFGGAFFRTIQLTFVIWIKIGCLAFSVIIASETFKAIKRFLRKERI